MFPRVSSAGTARATRPCGHLVRCKFASGADIAHYVQQEVMIEGVMHVSAAQAGSCMERFGDLDGVSAPALPTLDDVLTSGRQDSSTHSTPSSQSSPNRANSTSERVVDEAFCLATPPDNPAESNSPLRQQQPSPVRSMGTASPGRSSVAGQLQEADLAEDSPRRLDLRSRGGSEGSSSMLNREAEEFLQLEAGAYQRAYVSAQAMYTSEALQASAAIRRQRRRALVRLLRHGRVVTSSTLSALQSTPPAQLLASIGTSISSVASWDDVEPGAEEGGVLCTSRHTCVVEGCSCNDSHSCGYGCGGGGGPCCVVQLSVDSSDGGSADSIDSEDSYDTADSCSSSASGSFRHNRDRCVAIKQGKAECDISCACAGLCAVQQR